MKHLEKVREAMDEMHDLLVLPDAVSVRALMQFDKVAKYAEAALSAHEQEVAELVDTLIGIRICAKLDGRPEWLTVAGKIDAAIRPFTGDEK